MNFIFSPTKALDHLILMQIVLDGPQHGYAITSAIEEKFCWKPSQTAVYNSLKSMESESFVTVEEKIEKGRVQRIYSITELGQQYFESIQQKMRNHMMKFFSQFFSFIQAVGDIELMEESEDFQEIVQTTLENVGQISQFVLLLLRQAPKETQTTIENTLSTLKEIATKHNISFQELGNRSE